MFLALVAHTLDFYTAQLHSWLVEKFSWCGLRADGSVGLRAIAPPPTFYRTSQCQISSEIFWAPYHQFIGYFHIAAFPPFLIPQRLPIYIINHINILICQIPKQDFTNFSSDLFVDNNEHPSIFLNVFSTHITCFRSQILVCPPDLGICDNISRVCL